MLRALNPLAVCVVPTTATWASRVTDAQVVEEGVWITVMKKSRNDVVAVPPRGRKTRTST